MIILDTKVVFEAMKPQPSAELTWASVSQTLREIAGTRWWLSAACRTQVQAICYKPAETSMPGVRSRTWWCGLVRTRSGCEAHRVPLLARSARR